MTILDILGLCLSIGLMIVLGYLITFRTDSVIAYYLKEYEKNYLRSLKKNHFLSRYNRSFIRRKYLSFKIKSKQKFYYYQWKLIGVFLLLMATVVVAGTINKIFGVTFGIFTNQSPVH
jgi:hypothetical protein